MALWDITDTPEESHDDVTISIDFITNTIANMDKYKLSMNEFIKTWKDSYYPDIRTIVEHHILSYDGNACSPPPFWVGMKHQIQNSNASTKSRSNKK